MPTFLKSCVLLLIALSDPSGGPPDRIWQGGSAPTAQNSCNLNVASWNIERGRHLQAAASSLKQLSSAIVLTQESDMNARRTGNQNIAEQLALRLGLNYLFAAEFEELGQRVQGKPAYHGQAILTALPFNDARIIRFRSQTKHWQPRWYLPSWAVFQRRTGGRIALVVEVGTGQRRLILYNAHLESRGPETLRLRQIEDVIVDAQRYTTDTPILVAGDLNTREADSPVARALLKAGFRKAVGQEITTARGAALDWIFVRGLVSFSNGTVHREVKASDHFPLSVQIRLETPDCR